MVLQPRTNPGTLLSTFTLPYSDRERERWCAGNSAMLAKSKASSFIKRVLAKKHAVRPRRFFGEAFVASQIEHDEGYYCPFKWLTSASWLGDSDLNNRDAREFREALARHFPRLAEFQERARSAKDRLGGTKPVGPDLWLVAGGRHWFIEVKLPKDSLAKRQVAGLALLATSLQSDRPVEVVIVTLDRTKERFNEYVEALTA